MPRIPRQCLTLINVKYAGMSHRDKKAAAPRCGGWSADGRVALLSCVSQGVTSKLSIVQPPCAFTNVSVVGSVSGTPPALVSTLAVTLAVASMTL
jgi:hypothetical protein